jgi:cyanoexosortase A
MIDVGQNRGQIIRWLLSAIAFGLIAIHLTLTWRTGNISFLGVGAIVWFAVGSRLWHQRHTLPLASGFASSLVGLAVLLPMLIRSLALPTSNFLGVYPFVMALGWLCLTSGVGKLRHYWRELTVLFCLGVPKVVLTPMVDFSPITAKFSTFLLWYSGFEVERLGTYITSSSGRVDVNMGCSGLDIIFYLLSLSVLCLLLFPLYRRGFQVLTPLLAVAIAFVTNGIRVAILAMLTGPDNRGAFDYWHTGNGSLVFALLAVCLLGGSYSLMLDHDLIPPKREPAE